MSATVVVAGVIQVAGAAVCPLVSGTVQRLKGVLQGRGGPPILQPYRELRRLWGKSAVDPQPTTAIYRLAPALVAACAAVGLLLVPIAGRAPNWGLGHDALVLVGLLALGRFTMAASAWDTGSGFGLMGASRDLTFAVFIEGVLLLVVLLAALPAGGSTDLVAMSHAASGADVWDQPAHWCAGVAFALVALAEAARQPVDNPDTHLELTMIHEGPLLEYAGRDLACLQWAASARLWIMALLASELFAPTTGSFWVRVVVLVATIGVLAVGVALIETSLAKMRILRVPVYLAGGAGLCLVGFVSWLAGGVV